jgi:hypothetical protein
MSLTESAALRTSRPKIEAMPQVDIPARRLYGPSP